LAYAMIHALLACTLAYWFVNVFAVYARDRLFYAPCVLCMVHIFYFTADTFSYFSDHPVYWEFGLSLERRLAGNLVVAVVIGVFVVILQRHLVAIRRHPAWQMASPPSILSCGMLILAAVSAKLCLIGQGFGPVYLDTEFNANTATADGLFTIIFSQMLGTFALGVAAIGFYHHRSPASRWILGIAVFEELSWHTLFTLSRHSILSTIVMLGLVLASFRGRKQPRLVYSTFFLVVTLAPAVLGIGNSTLLAALGRTAETSLQDSCDETAYRLSLSDFAIVLAEKPTSWETTVGLMVDAVRVNLPRILVPDKMSAANTYAHICHEIGLSDTTDYADTLFSAGVMLAGLPGLVILPCLYLLALCALAGWLTKKAGTNGLCSYLLLGLTICSTNIELGPVEIVAVSRLFLGICAPIAMAFWLLNRLNTLSAGPAFKSGNRRTLHQT
jgi:hypothetical protein